MNDWNDLNLAQRGDNTAWKRLVANNRLPMIRLATMITGSPEIARDVVQETFLELFRRPPRHQKGNLAAWIRTVTYHRALKEKKRNQRWAELEESEHQDPALTPQEALLQSDRNQRLYRSIQSLDLVHRSVLMLRFYGELTIQEIAKNQNIPLGTVKSRLFYAVRKCREQMNKKEFIND